MKKSLNVQRDAVVYTPEQLSEILGVKVSYVKCLLREKTLKGSKLGKFWRITKDSFDAFIAGFDQDGYGKAGVGADTLNRIRYHASLKSKDMTPGSIKKLEDNIMRLKAEIQTKDRFGKIPKIANLQSTVTLRENKKQRLESLPKSLDALSDKAYPGVKDLVNKNPDALEAMFTKEAQNPEAEQTQAEEDQPGEDGFSVETITMEKFTKDQMARHGPVEKPWRAMKVDSDS